MASATRDTDAPPAGTQTSTPFEAPNPGLFGTNFNTTFNFRQTPAPSSQETDSWIPPHDFDARNAFPNPSESTRDTDRGGTSADNAGWGRRTVEALQRRYRARRRVGPQAIAHQDRHDDVINDRNHPPPVNLNINIHPPPANGSTSNPQNGYKLAVFCLGLCVVIGLISIVLQDAEHVMYESSRAVIQDIAVCARHYKNNVCENNIAPALIEQCQDWKTCMNRDPTKVGRLQAIAKTVSGSVNELIDPITGKVLAVALAFLVVVLKYRHSPAPTGNQAPYIHMGALLPFLQMGRTEDPSKKRRLDDGNALRIQ